MKSLWTVCALCSKMVFLTIELANSPEINILSALGPSIMGNDAAVYKIIRESITRDIHLGLRTKRLSLTDAKFILV